FSLDSLALLMAYCEGSDPSVFYTCSQEIFKSEIDQIIFINDYVKDQYFQLLRQIYFVNGQNFIASLTPDDAVAECPRCQPVRMTLEGMANVIIPVDFSDPYQGNSFGLSSSYFNQMNQINPGEAVQLANFLGSTTGLDAAFADAMDSLTN